MSDDKDIFLQFLPVSEKFDYAKHFPKRSPDADFPYYQPKGDEPDAKYVRLALKLYQDGKFALVLRTLDFMNQEQPNSPHLQEMRFLRANALLKLGMVVEGERILTDLKIQNKGKPVALYSALYFASKQMEHVEGPEGQSTAAGTAYNNFKDPLGAYETFSWLSTHYPDHRLAWVFHLGAAEALASIKQTEQAAKEYLWVAENAMLPEQRAQGALRLGNLYLDRRQYAQALEAYSRALRYFHKEAEDFPAIHLNRGETLVGLGEPDEARKIFEAYFERYSGYPEGWRATLRLGEIYGRRAGAENEQISRKWFSETINRFPTSPGATLARMRLLPCGDHGGMTFEAAQRFFEGEARTFDAANDLSMVRYPELRALTQARSYTTLKHEDAAIEVVQAEMSVARAPQVKAELARLYEALFRKNIVILLDQGKNYEALTFFEERSKFRSKDVAAADPDYLLRLSLAASNLGLGQLADRLATEYRKASSADRAIATQSAEAAQGNLDLDSKLRLSEQNFAEARALWTGGETGKESEEGIKTAEKVRTQLEKVAPESPYSFEKEIILGLLEERQGKPKTARGHALKAQVLIPSSKDAESEKTALQIEGWLAGLEAKAGDPKSALGMYRDLESKIRAGEKKKKTENGTETDSDSVSVTEQDTGPNRLGVPPRPTLEQVLLAQGYLLEGQKRWGETAATYSKAVELGLGGNQALYGYARALLKNGGKSGRAKAKATLEKLIESKTNDFWKELAKETLANLQIRENQ